MFTGESGSEWSSPAHTAEPERSAERGVRGGRAREREPQPQSESDEGDGDGEQEREQTCLLERASSPPTSSSSGGAALGGGAGASRVLAGAGGGGGSAAPAQPLRIPELEQTRQLQVLFTLTSLHYVDEALMRIFV